MQNLSLNENLDKLGLFISVVYKELGLVSKRPNILFEESNLLNASHSMGQNYIKFKGNWRLNTAFLYNCPISKKTRLANSFLVIAHELMHRKQHETGELKDLWNKKGEYLGKNFKGTFYSCLEISEMKRNKILPPWEIPVYEQETELFLKCFREAIKLDNTLRAYFPKGVF